MNAGISALALLTLFTSIEREISSTPNQDRSLGIELISPPGSKGNQQPWDLMPDLELKGAEGGGGWSASSSRDVSPHIPAALTLRRPSKGSTASDLSGDLPRPANSMDVESDQTSRDSNRDEITEIAEIHQM
jgi:hypothetical protein